MHDRNHEFAAQEVNNTLTNRDCTHGTLRLSGGALMVMSDGCQATSEDSRSGHFRRQGADPPWFQSIFSAKTIS